MLIFIELKPEIWLIGTSHFLLVLVRAGTHFLNSGILFQHDNKPVWCALSRKLWGV